MNAHERAMRPQKPCHQPHGTPARWSAGCSCLPCCEAWRVYQGAKPPRVPVEVVLPRIDELIDCGLSVRGIARITALSRTTVQRIRNGGVTSVRRDTYDALVGVAR